MAISGAGRISIVIPTLNEGEYLEGCLKSINAQDFPGDVEIIIADGKSTDRTVKIAREYGAKVVVEPKRTIAAGRQAGAKAASGDIVVFTDADARPKPGWLMHLCEPFSKGDAVVCTYGTLSLYDYRRTAFFFGNVMSAYLFWADVFGIAAGAGSNMAVRKDVFHKIGGFDPELITGEDIEIQTRLRKYGGIEFCRKAKARVSARRLRSWGLMKFMGFHASNMVKLQLTGKGHDEYEPVR